MGNRSGAFLSPQRGDTRCDDQNPRTYPRPGVSPVLKRMAFTTPVNSVGAVPAQNAQSFLHSHVVLSSVPTRMWYTAEAPGAQ